MGSRTRRGGVRAALSGLVRLPTGLRERSDELLDIGTGDGQTDIQVDLTTDFGAGSVGARVSGSYVRQLASTIQYGSPRQAKSSDPVASPSSAVIRATLLPLTYNPFFGWPVRWRFKPAFSIGPGRSDEVHLPHPRRDSLPGIDPAVLAEGSAANATDVSVGITYSNPGRFGRGGTGFRSMPVGRTSAWCARVMGGCLTRTGCEVSSGCTSDCGNIRLPYRRAAFSFLNSAWAWRRAASPSVSPSIRAISFTRSSPRSTCTSLVAMPPASLLRDHEMAVGPRRDLRKMGDDQHLMAFRHLGQRRPDLRPSLPTDSLIHLVEHQRGDGIVLHQNHLEREHEAGQLATGGHPGEGLGLESHIELHLQLHALLPVTPQVPPAA